MEEALTSVAEEQATPALDAQQDIENTSETETDDLGDNPETGEGDEGEGGDEPQEPELVDVEYEGKVHKLPPELKEALLRHADYTRKTQEVAEQRRAVEAKQAEINASYDVSQEVLQARAAIINIDGALQKYENVDWNRLEAEDPLAAQSHWRQFQQLQQQRGQVAQYLDKTQADLSEKANQATETRLRETRSYAEKELKGWTPELDNKITQFATQELGFTVDDLRAQYTPQVYRTLYLAHLGHQALSQMQAKPKPAPQKPLETVQAKAAPAARVSPEKMPMEDFAKWINKR